MLNLLEPSGPHWACNRMTLPLPFTFYAGIKIFNSLLHSLTILKNGKIIFTVALTKYLNTRSFYSVDEFSMCTDDLCTIF